MLTPFSADMVDISVQLVSNASNFGIQHIVKLSVMGADAEPGITLSRWHREVEVCIEESGIPYTFLRPNSFMQNFVNYDAEMIRTQGELYQPVGEGRVSFIDARDVGAVTAELITTDGHEGMAYTVTGPEAISYAQAADILSRVMDKEILFVDISEDDAQQGMKGTGMPDWMIESILELAGLIRNGYMSTVTSMVEDITGVKPGTFEKFVRDNVAAWQ